MYFLFHFLDRHFGYEVLVSENDNAKKCSVVVLSEIGELISADVIDVVITECLKHSIPSSHKDLEKYHEVIAETETFQSELIKLKFIKENNSALTDFVK